MKSITTYGVALFLATLFLFSFSVYAEQTIIDNQYITTEEIQSNDTSNLNLTGLGGRRFFYTSSGIYFFEDWKLQHCHTYIANGIIVSDKVQSNTIRELIPQSI